MALIRMLFLILSVLAANVFAETAVVSPHSGERHYRKVCYSCHDRGTEDVTARGAPRLGNTQAWDILRKRGVDGLATSVISPVPGRVVMPRADLTDDQIRQAVEYMLYMADPRAQASQNVEESRGIPALD